MLKEEVIKYKVFTKRGNILLSFSNWLACCKKYELKIWNKADFFGILVFDTLKDAQEFKRTWSDEKYHIIYKVACKEEVKLKFGPNYINVWSTWDDFVNMWKKKKLDKSCGKWATGTRAFKYIKIIEPADE